MEVEWHWNENGDGTENQEGNVNDNGTAGGSLTQWLSTSIVYEAWHHQFESGRRTYKLRAEQHSATSARSKFTYIHSCRQRTSVLHVQYYAE